MSGPAEQYLTRNQAVEFLNERGYPMTLSTFAKLCMPARDEGPPAEGMWGNRVLYAPSKLLGWARARFRARAA